MGREERPPLDWLKVMNAALMAGLPEESVTVTDEGDLTIKTDGLSPQVVEKALRNVLELMDQDRQGVEETEE